MCFSVRQFIVKIFAIIFVSGDTKYKGLESSFFCVDINNWFKTAKSS